MNFVKLPADVVDTAPLIYMWEIRDGAGRLMGRYVGKAKDGANRPLKHYKRNVANILVGKPYRKSKPNGFRRIHRALAEAEAKGFQITLRFLCNIGEDEDINEVEQRHIREQNSQGAEPWQLNG